MSGFQVPFGFLRWKKVDEEKELESGGEEFIYLEGM
jgi:hypothetical protein